MSPGIFIERLLSFSDVSSVPTLRTFIFHCRSWQFVFVRYFQLRLKHRNRLVLNSALTLALVVLCSDVFSWLLLYEISLISISSAFALEGRAYRRCFAFGIMLALSMFSSFCIFFCHVRFCASWCWSEFLRCRLFSVSACDFSLCCVCEGSRLSVFTLATGSSR